MVATAKTTPKTKTSPEELKAKAAAKAETFKEKKDDTPKGKAKTAEKPTKEEPKKGKAAAKETPKEEPKKGKTAKKETKDTPKEVAAKPLTLEEFRARLTKDGKPIVAPPNTRVRKIFSADINPRPTELKKEIDFLDKEKDAKKIEELKKESTELRMNISQTTASALGAICENIVGDSLHAATEQVRLEGKKIIFDKHMIDCEIIKSTPAYALFCHSDPYLHPEKYVDAKSREEDEDDHKDDGGDDEEDDHKVVHPFLYYVRNVFKTIRTAEPELYGSMRLSGAIMRLLSSILVHVVHNYAQLCMRATKFRNNKTVRANSVDLVCEMLLINAGHVDRYDNYMKARLAPHLAGGDDEAESDAEAKTPKAAANGHANGAAPKAAKK